MKIPKWRKRQLKNIGLFLLFIGLIYLINYLHLTLDKSEVSPHENTVKYKVKYLYNSDGDTATFRLEDGSEVSCRFLAVDAPEIGEEGYEEAKRFTDTTLEKASKIIIELDPNSERYDKFDRLLAWVWVDGELMQEKLLVNNLAQLKYLFHDYLYIKYLENLQKNVTQ